MNCPFCKRKIGKNICRNKECDFSYGEIDDKKGIIDLYFMGNHKLSYPLSEPFDVFTFIENNLDRIRFELKQIKDIQAEKERKASEKKMKETLKKHEKEMNDAGYFKEKMCPFTQVKVGGTRAGMLAFTGASMNEYVWTHSTCIEEYCAIWDKENNCCSIKTIAQNIIM